MWICVKESLVELSPCWVAFTVQKSWQEIFYFFMNNFYKMIDFLPDHIVLILPDKPFPGVHPVDGRLIAEAFLVTLFFTWIVIHAIPDSMTVLLILAAWVLFLLFLSSVFCYQIIKGFFSEVFPVL